MDQKRFANIARIVLVIILAGVVGYLTLVKKPASTTAPAKPIPQPVSWDNLIPKVWTVVKPEFQEFQSDPVAFDRQSYIRIIEKADITGDGIQEALVSMGSRGATNGWVVLLRIENDEPITANFKQKDGKIS